MHQSPANTVPSTPTPLAHTDTITVILKGQIFPELSFQCHCQTNKSTAAFLFGRIGRAGIHMINQSSFYACNVRADLTQFKYQPVYRLFKSFLPLSFTGHFIGRLVNAFRVRNALLYACYCHY